VAIERDGTAAEHALYHLANDPGELENLVHEHPVIVAQLEAAVRSHRDREIALSHKKRKISLDPRTREHLQSLGYVDDGDEPTSRDKAR
jgi:hypothetical protein